MLSAPPSTNTQQALVQPSVDSTSNLQHPTATIRNGTIHNGQVVTILANLADSPEEQLKTILTLLKNSTGNQTFTASVTESNSNHLILHLKNGQTITLNSPLLLLEKGSQVNIAINMEKPEQLFFLKEPLHNKNPALIFQNKAVEETANLLKEIIKKIAPDLSPALLLGSSDQSKKASFQQPSTIATPAILTEIEYNSPIQLAKLIESLVMGAKQENLLNQKSPDPFFQLRQQISILLKEPSLTEVTFNDITPGVEEAIKSAATTFKDVLSNLLKKVEYFSASSQMHNWLNESVNSNITNLLGEIVQEIIKNIKLVLTNRDNATSDKVAKLLNEFVKIFDNLTSSQSGSAVEAQEKLQHFLSKLTENKISGSDVNRRADTNPMAMLDNLLQGQELLRKISPIMQQLGEPVFLLIPGFLQGLLQKTEVTFYPLNEGEKEKKRGSNNGYQRISTSCSFPSIGKVKADVAYRTDHVLISLAAENEDIVEFLDKHTHLLKSGLSQLGFQKVELITRLLPENDLKNKIIGENQGIDPRLPQWVAEVIGIKAIA